MTKDKGTYCILSLDGGGVRSILETTILKRILDAYPNFLDNVDLITGASAGGILALVLASGKTTGETQTFFKKIAPEIFHKSWIHEITSLDSAIAPAYTNSKLRQGLQDELGDITLGQLKKKVLIPSFQLDNESTAHLPTPQQQDENNKHHHESDKFEDFEMVPRNSPQVHHRRWVPRFFHNMKHSKTNSHPAVDVALRTSAAPTYFPIYQGFVDGGVFANNPALCAITSAMSSGVPLENIVVLSLSTGRDGKYVSPEKYGGGDWGLAQWAPTLIDMLLDSNVEITDYQCHQLLGIKYHRIDPLLPRAIDLDQPKYIPMLESVANNVDLTDTVSWIEKFWFNAKPVEDQLDKTPTTSPTSTHMMCSLQTEDLLDITATIEQASGDQVIDNNNSNNSDGTQSKPYKYSSYCSIM
ncbi:hypothetical protein SAMD00019534_045970 [Acytostelium subglobosum LB1]|uniref:hypothetical protein n=1 Tax=Acytostelium subglobosum LB1 TaxID=1410327 RepID=UPI000644BD1B|nr:hypothetical protein SAMD00019534_045970 [Acytostelium subglobosum LB1]GAM21422.1 hypothetical protein SAMD00019534_045970 [Acytostelium subglobosum LB1]|eukprot:XP_012755541.1 hypothetical protein SAMD00019534_045970 [Acytostelium subglobosum LB1]